MIETYWGKPVTLIEGPDGNIRKISNVEQALFQLGRKWPRARGPRHRKAMAYARAATECLADPVAARRAFIEAAHEAGMRVAA